MRFEGLVFAAIPTIFTLWLIKYAFSEDSYFQNGQSYWDTHSSGRWVFILAVLINLVAVAALLRYASKRTSKIWGGATLAIVGVLVNAFAWVALTAN